MNSDFSSILDVILKQNKLIAPLVNNMSAATTNSTTPPSTTTTTNTMMSTCTPVSTTSTPSPSMAIRMNAITIPKRNETQQMEDDNDSSNSLFDTLDLHGVSGIRKPNAKKKINFACTECRKAHKGCNGERPCARCKKLGIESKCMSSCRKKNRVMANKYWKNVMNGGAQQQLTTASSPTSSQAPPFFSFLQDEDMHDVDGTSSEEEFKTPPQQQQPQPTQHEETGSNSTQMYAAYIQWLLQLMQKNQEHQSTAPQQSISKQPSPPSASVQSAQFQPLVQNEKAMNQIQALQKQFQEFTNTLDDIGVDSALPEEHYAPFCDHPAASSSVQVPSSHEFLDMLQCHDDVIPLWSSSTNAQQQQTNVQQQATCNDASHDDDPFQLPLEFLEQHPVSQK